MVADVAMRYGHEVVAKEEDVVPLMFAAYYHDSIEDARLTYNDVTAIARKYMDAEQAYMAAEIVYALTNDKGRTRSERAGDKYYEGIRNTRYASFLKMCDRLANLRYSTLFGIKSRMAEVYEREHPHFIASIGGVPAEMIAEAERYFTEGLSLPKA
jgi:hypothetical protein